MGAIDEAPQIIRFAIKPTGREEIDAVVTPAEFARKIRHRHHLDQANASPRQLGQLFGGRSPRSLRGKGADVHLVEDLPFQMRAAPTLVGPLELCRIDQTGGAMRPTRLIPRNRIGMQMLPAIEPETVKRSRSRRRGAGEVAAVVGREGIKFAPRIRRCRGFNRDFDALRLRSPETEMRFAGRQQFGADRQTAPHKRFDHAFSSPMRHAVVAASGENRKLHDALAVGASVAASAPIVGLETVSIDFSISNFAPTRRVWLPKSLPKTIA